MRKSYDLAGPLWRTAPWKNIVKDKEQLLYDLGFSLACLLEQTDGLEQLAASRTSTSKVDLLLDTINSSLELLNALEKFKGDYFINSTILSDTYPIEVSESLGKAFQQVEMDFKLESLVMTWWSFSVILAFTNKRLSELAHQHTWYSSSSILETLKGLVEILEDDYRDIDRSHIGRKVLRTIGIILQSNMGHFWFSRTIFPLTAATLQFYQSKPDMDICERIKDQITIRKGFRFAQRLTSQLGRQISFVDDNNTASVQVGQIHLSQEPESYQG